MAYKLDISFRPINSSTMSSVNVLQLVKNKIRNRIGSRINEKRIASKSKKYFHEACMYNLKASRAIERYEALLRQTEKQIETLRLKDNNIHDKNTVL